MGHLGKGFTFRKSIRGINNYSKCLRAVIEPGQKAYSLYLSPNFLFTQKIIKTSIKPSCVDNGQAMRHATNHTAGASCKLSKLRGHIAICTWVDKPVYLGGGSILRPRSSATSELQHEVSGLFSQVWFQVALSLYVSSDCPRRVHLKIVKMAPSQ